MYQVSRNIEGYEPHIICAAASGYPEEEVLEGIHFHRIRIGRLYKRLFQKLTRLDPYSYAARAARIIDALRPDIVHVHNTPKVFTKLYERCRWKQARFILHMHNEKQVEELPAGASLFVVSDYLRRWYQARLPSTDIAVVTNGVDIEAFQPSWALAEDPAARKLRHGIPPNKKVILYVGRMSPEKGPLDLALAFQELIGRRRDVLLLLVGEFSTGNASTNSRAEYGDQIRNVCRELGKNCVIVGSVDPATIHEYFHLGDLVVVPSEFEEPFCMVAIEAMAAGVPALVAKKGGLPEFIIEGQTGFFIDDTKDSNAFAQQIGELLDRLPTLDPVRSNARHYVEQNNSWQKVGQQLESAYSKLLNAN